MVCSGESFLTPPGALSELLSDACETVIGDDYWNSAPRAGHRTLRFIKDYCPVVDFGLVGQTMHKVDERVLVSDVEALSRIYRSVLDGFFSAGQDGLMQSPPPLAKSKDVLRGLETVFVGTLPALHFGTDEASFWKSFWCAVIILPAFVVLLMLVPDELRVDAPFHRTVIVEAIAYTIGWTAWPLVAHWLSGVLKFQDRYIPYIVAYNWSSGPQVAVLLAVFTLGAVVNAPVELIGLINLFAVLWLLIYHGYIVRTMTGAGGGVIFLMVVLEAVLGSVIIWGRDTVLLGGQSRLKKPLVFNGDKIQTLWRGGRSSCTTVSLSNALSRSARLHLPRPTSSKVPTIILT